MRKKDKKKGRKKGGKREEIKGRDFHARNTKKETIKEREIEKDRK